MNKLYNVFAYILLLCVFVLSGCIRSEGLNAEADIISVDSVWYSVALNEGIVMGTPRVENDKVIFTLRGDADVSGIAPIFMLTPGATISPANGTTLDFSKPQSYVVTSENGMWQKTYTVSFETTTTTLTYSFENSELSSSYYRFYELAADSVSKQYIWASGNAGFAFTGMAATPYDYPTIPIADGVKGNAVKLQTLSTGYFGRMVYKPIAAGNLFIGEFSSAQAMAAPLLATRFGLSILSAKPLFLRGFYKYTAGAQVTNAQSSVIAEMSDSCDIYAVVFECDPNNFVPLNGSDVLTSDRVVLIARPDYLSETNAWTQFTAEFDVVNGKVFDNDRLTANGYAMALVCTSSRSGANFVGAVGSTLIIDEIEITSVAQ